MTLDFTQAVIVQPSLLIDADVNASRLTLVTKPGVVVDTDEVAAEGSYVKVRAHRGSEVPVILRMTGIRHGQRRPHHGTPAAPDLLAVAAAPSPAPRACLALTRRQ